MVTAAILPLRENSHGWAENQTRNLMISSQRLWPLDYEAGRFLERKNVSLGAVAIQKHHVVWSLYIFDFHNHYQGICFE